MMANTYMCMYLIFWCTYMYIWVLYKYFVLYEAFYLCFIIIIIIMKNYSKDHELKK